MNPTREYSEKSISIQELFFLLRRCVILIIAVGLVGGIATYCVCSFFVSPVYEASAKMIVNTRQDQTGNVTSDQITSAQKLVDTYGIIIRSRKVLEPVSRNLDIPMTANRLAGMVTVTSVNDTQVMQIAVQSKDPDLALQIVEQIVDICPNIIIDTVGAGSVKTIEEAYLNKTPVAPNTNLYTVLAAFLCMVIVVVVIVLCFLLDNSYKSESALRNDLELPVLGVIPDYECCQKHKYDDREGKRYGKA